MKQITIKIGNVDTIVTVVNSTSKKEVLTPNEIEMDRRAESAVKAALLRAKICKKPIAKYNVLLEKQN